MSISDWSSDVCSSDLRDREEFRQGCAAAGRRRHQAVAHRAAVGPHPPGGEFPQAAAGDVERYPRAAGQAGRPPAQHADAAFHRHAGRSEEHKSELQSLMRISYAVFCLKKKNTSEIKTL